MNVNIPPHPPTPHVRSINCFCKFTWTLTSHPTPPPHRMWFQKRGRAYIYTYIHIYIYKNRLWWPFAAERPKCLARRSCPAARGRQVRASGAEDGAAEYQSARQAARGVKCRSWGTVDVCRMGWCFFFLTLWWVISNNNYDELSS